MPEPSFESDVLSRLRSSADVLACGESIDELLEQVADGSGGELNAHQHGCVHCQAALREFDELWEPVREHARLPVLVPQRLVAAIMSHVDKLVADVWYTLQITEGGAITIAARVVATIARDTARLVPGVRVALGRSTESRVARLVERATLGHRHPHAAVGVLGRTAVVHLALAVTYGDPVHDVAHEVQRRVMAELRDNIGLKSVTVNVTVDDVIAGV
jgi:uncharacterized alkaline shock family protein YloU